MSMRVWVLMVLAGAAAGTGWGQAGPAEAPKKPAEIRLKQFLPVQPISRAQRPSGVQVVVENVGELPGDVLFKLVLPEGVRAAGCPLDAAASIAGGGEASASWTVEAAQAGAYELRVLASVGNGGSMTASLGMDFLTPVAQQRPGYIPAPVPAASPLLVGAHHCPLWEADKPQMWSQLLKHRERTPALGFYAQENPEISDWETKWASEHGIDFFIYCWYRSSQGGPVQTRFSSAIHEGLFKSRYADKIQFTIMWENQVRGQAGVSDEADLLVNLLPYWIENYFKHPSYVKVDNKPLLFIYRPEFLVEDLGSEANVVQAFDKMRQACRDAGFDGLYLLGEYRGLDPEHLKKMKRLGLDYTFAYCWYVPDNPSPAKAIETQMGYIKKTQELGILPQVVTVSQGWSGWQDEGTIWTIPPTEYKTLLQQGKDFVSTLPAQELGSKMLLLDNWNEWGEGHYIAPYRQYGFGYVDAVRAVLTDAPAEHQDLIPEDIGLGPYDTAYRAYEQQAAEARKAGTP